MEDLNSSGDEAPKVGMKCEGCQKAKATLHLDEGMWRCAACHALRRMKRRWDDEKVVYF